MDRDPLTIAIGTQTTIRMPVEPTRKGAREAPFLCPRQFRFFVSRLHSVAYLALLLLVMVAVGSRSTVTGQSLARDDRSLQAERVKAEFLHAWSGYRKYAWGHDELKPLSKSWRDWHRDSLMMTQVDALDTMILMDLGDEARTTRLYLDANLSFDRDIEVQNFETTIRLLGGLLSSYQLTGDRRLLVLAEDLGDRLLPVFNSPTGMPYRFVNLKTGKVRDAKSNPAEIGTLLI